MESKIENFKDDIVKTVKQEIVEDIKEEKEIERKQPNLIIFNLKESESGNSEEQTQHDKTVCSDIFENVIRINNFEIMEVARLGKEPDNSRLLEQNKDMEKRTGLYIGQTTPDHY